MKTTFKGTYPWAAAFCALAGASSFTLLAGCSNSGPSQLPATGPLTSSPLVSLEHGTPSMSAQRENLFLVDPATVKGQIYVSAYNASAPTPVNDYNVNNKKNGKYFCQITSVGEGINAIGVNSNDELWVPQGLDPKTGAGDVVSYAPNCGAAGTTLTGLKGQPAGIGFAPNGTTYVNDIVGPSSTAGNIAVFPKLNKKPARFLTNPQVFYANGIGVDSKGNVYLSYFSATSATGVIEFKGGQMPGTVLKNVHNGAPGAIAFDKNDNLIITDDAAVTLNVYAPPYTKAPKTYPLKGHSPQCSLNATQTNLACADKTNTSVDIFAYPSGSYLYSFSNGLLPTVIGIAQDPR